MNTLSLDQKLAVLRTASQEGEAACPAFADQAELWVRVALDERDELHRYLSDVATSDMLSILTEALWRGGFEPAPGPSFFRWEFWVAPPVTGDRPLRVADAESWWEALWWLITVRIGGEIIEANEARRLFAQGSLAREDQMDRFRLRSALAFEDSLHLRIRQINGSALPPDQLAQFVQGLKERVRDLIWEINVILDDAEVDPAKGRARRERFEGFLARDFLREDVPRCFARHVLIQALAPRHLSQPP